MKMKERRRRKKKKEEETTGVKHNGLSIAVGGHKKPQRKTR